MKQSYYWYSGYSLYFPSTYAGQKKEKKDKATELNRQGLDIQESGEALQTV